MKGLLFYAIFDLYNKQKMGDEHLDVFVWKQYWCFCYGLRATGDGVELPSARPRAAWPEDMLDDYWAKREKEQAAIQEPFGWSK